MKIKRLHDKVLCEMLEMDPPTGWNVEMEVNLFHAMRGHKPVGVNRHFQMLFIHEKLASSHKKITAKQIWDTLGHLYDLQALNESEILPFPNKITDFTLSGNDFNDLKEKKFPRLIADTSKSSDDSKSDSKHDKAEKHDRHEKQERLDRHDSRDSVSSKSSKSETRHSLGTPVLHTPDNSPKRKRTRQTPSTISPASTPDAPPSKRRR